MALLLAACAAVSAAQSVFGQEEVPRVKATNVIALRELVGQRVRVYGWVESGTRNIVTAFPK
jgi:hypothetical protein